MPKVIGTLRPGLMVSLALLIGVTLFNVACGDEAPAVPAATTAPAAPAATAAPAAPAATATTAAPRATAAPAPTKAPATGGEFKIKKLRFAMPSPALESNRTWAGGWNYISQHDVFAETLLRGDPATAKTGPLLAESWEATNEFKTWSFKLREDVPFQFGYGEFTAQDVLHTMNLLKRDDSLATMLESAWSQVTIEIVDDHNIKFHFENPYLAGLRLFSRHAGDLIIMSDAQFKAKGVEGTFDQIQTAGTGPYQLTERKLGESLTYERVPEGHYFYDVDFEEFEFVWAAESVTRMAMLLAGEVQVAQIERHLQPEAEARGMRVIQGTQDVAQTLYYFGGMYGMGDKLWYGPGNYGAEGDVEKFPDIYTPGLPLENINVRKALNKAVDRDAINEEIYLGRASTNYVHAFHPLNEGWNPEWVEKWDEMYGYDPEAATAILAAEGYTADNPLKIKAIAAVVPGTPEQPEVLEAMGAMWAEIGVEMSMVRLDVGQWVARIREHSLNNTILPMRNLPIRLTQEGVRNQFSNTGFAWAYPHPVVQENLDNCMEKSADLEVRDKCARNIGDIIYNNYGQIPGHLSTSDLTVDPEFIAGYVFTGMTSAGVSHFYNIKGVKK